jgi:mRNA interferase RelE/StbE
LAPVKAEYKASVARDLAEIEASTAHRIVNKIERAHREKSRRFLPRSRKFSALVAQRPPALTASFAGLFRLRVGDYRVIYARTTEGYLVLRIAHRSEIYRKEVP